MMDAVTQLGYALDTFYVLVSGALVMWMAAGFAMLEAGLVRARNTVEILTKNVALYAVTCIVYLLLGHGIMYPGGAAAGGWWPGFHAVIGRDDHTLAQVLAGGAHPPGHAGLADFFFQVVFAATAMSIVSGAVAERMKLWAFLAFAVAMAAFIYPLEGYWKWGGGFLAALGFRDFAGSGVVHLCGAAAALAGVLLLGPRRGKYGAGGRVRAIPGANLPLATLGTFVLWLGWLGFNGGSQLKVASVVDANAVALVMVNTNLAGAGGALLGLVTARLLFGKADLTMSLNGALAGLVSITAEPLAPSPLWAVLVGAVAGVLVVFAIVAVDKLKVDDPVGAVSVHGIGGMWGLLAVPLSNGAAGFGAQLVGLLTIFAWVFGASFVVWLAIRQAVGLRVSEQEEFQGMDLVECGVQAYPEFAGGHGAGG
jgi:Amt family ammonium transporter